MDAKLLKQQADDLFSKRGTVLTLWQEIADNFYPEQGMFTLRKTPGIEFASHLYSSYPLITRRELGSQIGMMLRPTNKPWFHPEVEDWVKRTNEESRFLEYLEKTQRKIMYDPIAQMNRALTLCDHDFATFGQGVVQVTLNRKKQSLLFKQHHLKDVVWAEDEAGVIYFVAVRTEPSLHELMQKFKGKCHRSIEDEAKKNPFGTNGCYHIVVSSEMYDGDSKGKPYVSIHYDNAHNHVMEEMPILTKEYIIPQWQKISGSQYALSPATIIGLPDARLIQAMAFTLLQAGEKLVNPPLVAQSETIRGDVNVYPGGITISDREYDERLGEALRPMNINANGMPLGLDMLQDTRAILKEALYLNKIGLPDRGAEMTAYEIGQRVQEYIRGALPLFAPMEETYNAQLCDLAFETSFNAGFFGPATDIPKSMRGAKIRFTFESPLHDAIEEQLGHKFVQMKGLVLEAMALDQEAVALPDVAIALRQALAGIKTPSDWVRSETTVAQMKEAQASLREASQVMEQVQQGADIAKTLGITNGK